MLARMRKTIDDKDQGFTLIELLVVMIIIGILAAIAIPVFLNQKKKAAETSAKTDASNISREIAAAFTDGAPASLTLTGGNNSAGTSSINAVLTAGSDTTNVKVGAKNTATLAAYVSPATDYCVTVTPAQSGASAWSAGNNGLLKGPSCPGA